MANQRHRDDRKIIQAFFNRDEDAIRMVDACYGKYLRTIAGNIVSDSRDCEECVFDAYLSAWNSIPPASPDNLLGYLISTVRRTAISMNRKKNARKRGKGILELPFDECENELPDGQDPIDFLEQQELSRIISEFVQSLPREKKYCFIARYYLGSSIKAIASELNLSEATIFRLLAEIRESLRTELQKGGIEV